MNTLFIAARAVHFASAMLLLGELVFVLAVAKPAWRDAGHVAPGEDQGIRHRLLVVALWAIVESLASGAAWLAAETTVISGMPIERAMNPDTLVLVLGKTVFGRVWTLRLGLIVGLCALLLAMRRSTDDSVRSRWTIGAALVAAAYLATLAWAGHAAAGQGLDRFVQIASDAVHLLAA